MSIQELYLLVGGLVVVLLAILLVPVYRNRHHSSAPGLLIVIVGGIAYTVGLGLTESVTTPQQWTYAANLALLGAKLSIVGYALVVADYANVLKTTRKTLLVAAMYPVTVQLALWSNSVHHLAWDPYETLNPAAMTGPHEAARILIWGHATIGYSLILIALMLALREAVRSSGRRRLQSVALFATAFPPSFLYLLSDLDLTTLNLAPIGGLAQAFALIWVLFYASFLNVIPAARYRAVERMTDPFVTIDPRGTVIDSNPAARQLAAVGPDWERMPIAEFFHHAPRQATRLTAVDTVAFDTESDGERHFDVTSSPVYAPDGTLEAHQIVLREITARVTRENALQASRERYRSLFESSPIVLWELDLSAAMNRAESIAAETTDLTTYLEDHPEEYERVLELVDVLEVNQNALDAYGASSKKDLVEQLPDLQTAESLETNRQLVQQLLDGACRLRDETTYRTLDGEIRHELFELTVLQTTAEDYSRVLLASIDVTESKTYERRLEAHNRTLERLAGIISHDLQTPLSTAEKTTTLLSMELDDAEPDVLQTIDDLEQIHHRLREFTEYLPRFARESTNVEHTSECELAAVADAAWDVVDTHSLELVVESTCAVEADPSRLQQVFENLFQNVVGHGVEAVAEVQGSGVGGDESDGGLSSTPSGNDLAGEYSSAATTVRVGSTPHGFFVADDGPGIGTTALDEIFDYGMGTGDGSGFGLAIVRTIVEAHGWRISATDSETGGARFEISTAYTDT
ncbi:PAS domain-containing protein [Natronolimnobius sp. AArcel1]|uniref:sensor histidine kinase n=1 Tax=Natronolimnobius sp. AArcel1 TaxID=1679093 RepID=UPI0013EC99E4|nr:histidine kinase N-terminal 7TM domain-containing protein [Natronolimnobius sp. AArcel1]NGM70388.1 PAS domain-containing protein [Natronolimnobius sp. AArcel1]